jgi:hypothetical protein
MLSFVFRTCYLSVSLRSIAQAKLNDEKKNAAQREWDKTTGQVLYLQDNKYYPAISRINDSSCKKKVYSCQR